MNLALPRQPCALCVKANWVEFCHWFHEIQVKTWERPTVKPVYSRVDLHCMATGCLKKIVRRLVEY